jgi:hypothetical protein
VSASVTLTELFRPVGPAELKLIEEAEFRAFPPRVPEQPIFYPVTNEAYAIQIARDWNTRHGSSEGFVTRFKVRADYLGQFDRKRVGGAEHEEYWIPAERLAEFNGNIVGLIEVIAHFVAKEDGAKQTVKVG